MTWLSKLSQSNTEQSAFPHKKKRLFFALWLNDEVIKKIQQEVIKHFLYCQGNILEAHNWHLTLAYFGTADPATQACLEEQADKIQSQPFALNLSQCGLWPAPKVAWLAPAEVPETLNALTHELQHFIQPCGFKAETRAFQPHITLVRKAKQPAAVERIAAINWQVSQFCLVESTSGLPGKGAQYTVLRRWDL
jgi:2'-5' RNA ligase